MTGGASFAPQSMGSEPSNSGVPGLGTLPPGYVAGQERLVNGRVVSAGDAGGAPSPAMVTPAAPRTSGVIVDQNTYRPTSARVAAPNRQAALDAIESFRGAPKQTIRINNARHEMAIVTSGGTSYAVIKNRAFLGGASVRKVKEEAPRFLPCAIAGGIWGGTGALAGTYAIPLACRLQ